MAKLYTNQTLACSRMLPKKETINFILNYSRVLNIVKVGTMNFEIIAN